MLILRLFIHRLRTTLPATAFPDILRAGHRRSGMPDERHIGGNINESGDPFERARANISCGGIWCGIVGNARQRAEAGRQHHRRSRTRYSRFRSAEGRRVRHRGTERVIRALRYAHLSRRQRQAAAQARTVLGRIRRTSRPGPSSCVPASSSTMARRSTPRLTRRISTGRRILPTSAAAPSISPPSKTFRHPTN